MKKCINVDVSDEETAEMSQFLTNHPNAEQLKLAGGLEEIKTNLAQFWHNETALVSCKVCGKRLLKFGLKIHEREFHSGAISGDVDSDVVARMKEEAAIWWIVAAAHSLDQKDIMVIVRGVKGWPPRWNAQRLMILNKKIKIHFTNSYVLWMGWA